jgi:hypothetical protein
MFTKYTHKTFTLNTIEFFITFSLSLYLSLFTTHKNLCILHSSEMVGITFLIFVLASKTKLFNVIYFSVFLLSILFLGVLNCLLFSCVQLLFLWLLFLLLINFIYCFFISLNDFDIINK